MEQLQNDPRKHGHGATCVQKHLLNNFCASGLLWLLRDISLTNIIMLMVIIIIIIIIIIIVIIIMVY